MKCPNPACSRWLKTGKDGVKAHLLSKVECLPFYGSMRWTRRDHDDLRNNVIWYLENGEMSGDAPAEHTEFSEYDEPYTPVAPSAIVPTVRLTPATLGASSSSSTASQADLQLLVASLQIQVTRQEMQIMALKDRVVDLERLGDDIQRSVRRRQY